VAYLPAVAASFVTAIVAGALGSTPLGVLFFGVGMFSWLALQSVVLRRLLEVAPVAAALRPTMGIHFAPPVVACVAYLSITSGTPDLLARALFAYGVFQGLVLVRLIPWLRAQPFAPSYWAYTFATAACALAEARFLERGLRAPIEWMAPVLFVIANVVIGTIFARSLWLLFARQALANDITRGNCCLKRHTGPLAPRSVGNAMLAKGAVPGGCQAHASAKSVRQMTLIRKTCAQADLAQANVRIA
jgi:tellurite resistance protein